MKLLTHNMLTSNMIKGVSKGYPLKINVGNVKVNELDFNSSFIRRMIPKLDWEALYGAAQSVGHNEGLPEKLPQEYEGDENLLKAIHHAILEVEVEEGSLECPETGRKFEIQNGIPNMLLNEDET